MFVMFIVDAVFCDRETVSSTRSLSLLSANLVRGMLEVYVVELQLYKTDGMDGSYDWQIEPYDIHTLIAIADFRQLINDVLIEYCLGFLLSMDEIERISRWITC